MGLPNPRKSVIGACVSMGAGDATAVIKKGARGKQRGFSPGVIKKLPLMISIQWSDPVGARAAAH